MNAYLRGIAAKQGGVVMRRQALDTGYTVEEVDYLVRKGEWVSLRRGAYVERSVYEAMTAEQRHLARIHAVTRSLHKPAIVSHTSAVVLRDLPTHGLDLSEVHVTRRDLHSPRHEAGVHHHAGSLPVDDVELVDGVATTSLARTTLDTARMSDFESAVVVADAAFHRDPAAHKLALEKLDTMRDWRGARNAGAVVEFADGRAESVGESLSRLRFREVGLPAPDLQRKIYAPNGALVGIADFLFEEHWTIGEFDGKGKYLRSWRPGEDAGDVVWREKQREDALRELGYEVVRLIWADLYRPWVIEQRFRRAFARAARLRRV